MSPSAPTAGMSSPEPQFYKDHDPPASSVWDARSGRRLKAFDRESQVGFTGDGLRLLAGGAVLAARFVGAGARG